MMKCIRVYYTDNVDGSTTVNALVDAQTGVAGRFDDWNTLCNVLRLRRTQMGGVLIWDEGSWDEKVWG